MISKRAFLTSAGALICVAVSRPAPGQVPAISMARHELFMPLAIDEARKNPVYPFGAVMVRPETGEVMARGVNRSGQNPTFHTARSTAWTIISGAAAIRDGARAYFTRRVSPVRCA